MKKIIFIGHSSYISKEKVFDANWSLTYGFLNHYFQNNYTVIRHSLYNGGESRIYNKGIDGKYKTIPLIGALPDALRYIAEIIINIFLLLYFKPKTVIAIDPLSCFAATLLKKLLYIKDVLFITPDFARQRFENKILNKIYFSLDKFCTLKSSKNVVCAQAVIDYKKNIYPESNKKDIFFHMPNIPNPWVIKKLEDIEKISNRIIYVGNISNQINFKQIIDAIHSLKSKFSTISLVIAGIGNYENEIKNYVANNNIDNVFFLGQLSYENTLIEIAKSEIGIALYNGSFNYDEFRDSCKIREYQSLSTIPLTTSVVKSNADEIEKYKSGILLEENQIFSTINLLFNDVEFKKSVQKNAYNNFLLYQNKFEDLYKLLKQI